MSHTTTIQSGTDVLAGAPHPDRGALYFDEGRGRLLFRRRSDGALVQVGGAQVLLALRLDDTGVPAATLLSDGGVGMSVESVTKEADGQYSVVLTTPAGFVVGADLGLVSMGPSDAFYTVTQKHFLTAAPGTLRLLVRCYRFSDGALTAMNDCRAVQAFVLV